MNVKELMTTREVVYKIVFSSLFVNNENTESLELWNIINDKLVINKEGLHEFIKTLKNDKDEVLEITEKMESTLILYLERYSLCVKEFNTLISKYLTGKFTIDKLAKADLAILYVAMLELKFRTDTSEKIIVNEAVNLSKKYSTENSYKFINGILKNLVKEMRDINE